METIDVEFIVKILLLITCVFFIWRSIKASLRDLASASWPLVTATAMESDVVEVPPGSRRGFLGSHAWRIQYAYVVDGQKYKSGEVMPFPNTTEVNALMMLDKMPPGTDFQVRYDPADPRETRMSTNALAAKIKLGVRIVIYVGLMLMVLRTMF